MVSPRAKPLLIFPRNGNGIEALDCLNDAYMCVGFIDDTPEKQGAVFGYSVWGREALKEQSDAQVLAVPGSAQSYLSREQIIRGLGIDNRRYATVIHPTARISSQAVIGYNVLIMAGVVITSNAVIGNHVCILPNAVIHHDVLIGAWTLLGSNVTIAGNTIIGENCYVGSGSSIMNGLQVGNRTLIGLGSNLLRSIAAGSKVAGNPAREI